MRRTASERDMISPYSSQGRPRCSLVMEAVAETLAAMLQMLLSDAREVIFSRKQQCDGSWLRTHAAGGITSMAQSFISQRSLRLLRSGTVLPRGGANSIRNVLPILQTVFSLQLKNVSVSAGRRPLPQVRSRASSACQCCCCRRLAWHLRVWHGRGHDMHSVGVLEK